MLNNISNDTNHLIRQRINILLANATQNPIITVCAGAGCGKTRAVSDFLKQQKHSFFWTAFAVQDNDPDHFWKSVVESTARINTDLAEKFKELGFPETTEKIEQFTEIRNRELKNRPYIIMLDDFHLLKEPAVIRFMEKLLNNMTSNLTTVLVGRDVSNVDIKVLQIRGLVSEVSEAELNFTEIELINCFKQQGIPLDSQTSREIHKDTGGWAFAINLVARSLARMPKYTGFVKNALKPNIFKFMESENWEDLPVKLQSFLVCLSLIDHISIELVDILAAGDDELLSELRKQSTYIHYDSLGGAYKIHHMYLDFLKSKQDILSIEERNETYKIAADWCNGNNFVIDALNYYEKISDYDSIVLIFFKFLEHTTTEFMLYANGIFERAAPELFDSMPFFAAIRLYTLLCLSRWEEFYALAREYEQRLINQPYDEDFRNTSLAAIYYVWGGARFLSSTFDDVYDFDIYFKKMSDCMKKAPIDTTQGFIAPVGGWYSTIGSSKEGAPQKYTESAARAFEYVSDSRFGIKGAEMLYHAEIKFYQYDLNAAEALFIKSLGAVRESGQFEYLHRALFYMLRISIMQGDRSKTAQALKDLEKLLDEEGYARRNITYDIANGWYHCIIRQLDLFPDWLKSEFAPYGHSYFIENYGNQIRARYYFLKRNYQPLLAYINEMKKRESVLYGRVEMLALEACVYYQMKDKPNAWLTLKQAYETASPNNIIMPFIELGKDMRTLTSAALREQSATDIPNTWLESVKNKSTAYAKSQSMFITENKLSETAVNKLLSAREQDVLVDLYHGFSQSDIARKYNLSINTVKMVTKSIYEKLHVHKISDLIRVAAEQRLV
jgi:LuxR family maltose regulon positive regulatory protein